MASIDAISIQLIGIIIFNTSKLGSHKHLNSNSFSSKSYNILATAIIIHAIVTNDELNAIYAINANVTNAYVVIAYVINAINVNVNALRWYASAISDNVDVIINALIITGLKMIKETI